MQNSNQSEQTNDKLQKSRNNLQYLQSIKKNLTSTLNINELSDTTIQIIQQLEIQSLDKHLHQLSSKNFNENYASVTTATPSSIGQAFSSNYFKNNNNQQAVTSSGLHQSNNLNMINSDFKKGSIQTIVNQNNSIQSYKRNHSSTSKGNNNGSVSSRFNTNRSLNSNNITHDSTIVTANQKQPSQNEHNLINKK